MKRFNDLLIRSKILTIVVMNVFFYLLIMTIVYLSIKRIQRSSNEIVLNNKAYCENLIADKMFDALRSDIQKALLIKSNNRVFIDDIKNDITIHDSTLKSCFGSIGQMQLNGETQELLKDIRQSNDHYSNLILKISGLLFSGDSLKRQQGLSRMADFKPSYDHLKVEMKSLTSLLEKSVENAEISIEDSRNQARMYVLLVILLAIACSVAFSLYVSNAIKRPVVHTKNMLETMASGNLPSKSNHESKDEIGEMLSGINSLIDNLHNVKDFANEVGGGKFDTQVVVFNNEGIVGKSLAGMRESLKKVSEEDKMRNWTNTGLTQISEITRQFQFDEQQLYDRLIAHMVRYLNANQGGIYLVNKKDLSKVMIDMVCCYAYNKKKFVKASEPFGTGLVGQCIQEQQTLFMVDIPKDYIKIVSGLGGANPSCLLIVPLKTNDEIIGAIELASFQTLTETEIDYIVKAGELIASVVLSVKVTTETKALLRLSQEQSEAMLSQDEEMRQNMEEMQATQEEVIRREAGYVQKIKELEATLSGYHQKIQN